MGHRGARDGRLETSDTETLEIGGAGAQDMGHRGARDGRPRARDMGSKCAIDGQRRGPRHEIQTLELN
jgi:hypothetical protein